MAVYTVAYGTNTLCVITVILLWNVTLKFNHL